MELILGGGLFEGWTIQGFTVVENSIVVGKRLLDLMSYVLIY